jgi:HK97 family phage prohead protease
MPYFITDKAPDCPAWAVVKEDGEFVGCHDSKENAINQMVAASLAEEIPPGGEYEGEFSRSNFSEAVRDRYEEVEERKVDLSPPAYMRAAARKGLEYLKEGKGGSGLTEKTKREARAMAQGNVTADKWVRIRAWIARHLNDLRSPNADPSAPAYPSPGVVAHLLWGSGPSIRAAERALKYAEGVIARLEEENQGRARGKKLSAYEVRVNNADWELRETSDGMTFEGYAAIFNSPSHPLSGSPRSGTFTERIAPGAFIRSLKSRNDIKLLWNHDSSDVLGSTRAGTLKLVEDERGLKVIASLPNTSTGRDAAELLKRGDVDAMSFGFTVPRNGDEWSADGTERILREVMLHEVSIVAFPAYGETAGTATVRGLAKIAARAQVDVDALSDALLKLENGEEMTEEDARLLNEVLDSIAPEKKEEEVSEPETSEPVGDFGMLELKKKKLELLLKGI